MLSDAFICSPDAAGLMHSQQNALGHKPSLTGITCYCAAPQYNTDQGLRMLLMHEASAESRGWLILRRGVDVNLIQQHPAVMQTGGQVLLVQRHQMQAGQVVQPMH